MKTWKQITNDKDFEPQYLELTIPSRFDNSGEEIITCLLIEERIDKSSLPDKWIAYDIRHSDDDDSIPATIENNVTVNFFGTILVSNELDLKEAGYIHINDYCYCDWEEVAEDELSAAEISLDYLDQWENLAMIDENIINCRRTQFLDELAPGQIVYVVAECDEPQGQFKVTKFTGEGPCIEERPDLGLTPYILFDNQSGDLPMDVPIDWLYPVLPTEKARYCPRCHGELLPEVHVTEMDYRWYCPNCQENMFNFEARKPCQKY